MAIEKRVSLLVTVMLVVLVCVCPGWCAAEPIAGIAFKDANGNGRFDEGEPGLAGTIVSDGVTCVATDKHGRYL
ncbi:MAG: hypothetical protein PHT33_03760, partial [bacterium]|nr:hypothetical protein [bacterium]